VTVQFMNAAAEHGVAFTPEDLARVAGTFADNVFLEGGRINTRIDRIAEPFDAFGGRVYGGMGSVVALLELADHHPALGPRIVEMVASRPEVGGWFGTGPAAVGYAALLRRGEDAGG
jgi:hypothetical protein